MSQATAQAAVDEMNGKEVFGGRLKVEITKSRKKTASEMEAKNDPTKKPRYIISTLSTKTTTRSLYEPESELRNHFQLQSQQEFTKGYTLVFRILTTAVATLLGIN